MELGCQVASPGSDPANTRYSWWLQGEHLDQEEGPSLSLDTAPGHHLGQEVQVTCAAGNTAGWGEAGHLNLTLLTGPTLTRALQPATPVLRSQVHTEQLLVTPPLLLWPGAGDPLLRGGVLAPLQAGLVQGGRVREDSGHQTPGLQQPGPRPAYSQVTFTVNCACTNIRIFRTLLISSHNPDKSS